MRLIDTTDERLYTPVEKVENPSSLSIKLLRSKMLKIIRSERGEMITANQVGKSLAIFIMLHNKQYLTCINPTIEWRSSNLSRFKETSISFPSIIITTQRSQNILGEYSDLKGNRVLTNFSGESSMRFQHCVDLLHGKTFIQHE